MSQTSPNSLSDADLDAIRQDALAFAGIGLYQYRFDGTLRFIDRGAIKIFEMDEVYPDPKMLMGKQIGALFHYCLPVGTLREQVRAHGHLRNVEYPYQTLTGKDKWNIQDAYIIHDPSTGEDFIQVIIQDITERKHAEEALRRAHEELEIRVQERTASEREQRMLAEALRDIAALLNSTLQLDEVLDRILSEIQKVVPHDTASIMLIEGGKARVVRHFHLQSLETAQTAPGRTYSLDELPSLLQMYQTKHSLFIEDTRERAGWIDLSEKEAIRSFLGAPIQRQEDVIGFINLNSAEVGFFKPAQAERLQAFADQAAIAIQNARLYERAKELAVLEERQRLARDLHDSVSQTLWTAALITDVLPTLWVQDQEEGLRNLAKLQRLNRGALAEMRTLLLELRPTTLVEARLGDLIQQLAQAVMSHKKIDIHVDIRGECYILADVKVGLYRLVQEALNNVVKHARATQVFIDLDCAPDQITLCIRDNGRGFDLAHASEGLGLGDMRERVEAIEASLEISSAIGSGTQVKITWPTRPQPDL